MKVFDVSIDPLLYQLLKEKGTPRMVSNLGAVNWQGLLGNNGHFGIDW